jgi:hypothetical protein
MPRLAACGALVSKRADSLKPVGRLVAGIVFGHRAGECCVKAFVLVALLLAGSGQALAEDAITQAKAVKASRAAPPRMAPQRNAPQVSPATTPAPLPAAVPEQFSPPQEAYASFPEAEAIAPAKPSACQLRLAKVATFKAVPVLIGPGECGALDAVILDGVILPDRAKVVVSPPATLRCTMAEEVAAWLRDDIAPAVLKIGAPLRGLDNFDSYECRGRNRVRGATLSEHGRANALDVRAFKLASGQVVELTDVNVAKVWREGIRAGACARFSTVLGPGSDGHHEEHIHVDLAERRGGYKMCQWHVREPVTLAEKREPPADTAAPAASAPLSEPVPLPRPRPLAANASRDVQLRASRARAQ